MRILIAPDSFKGSNSSLKVAEAIEKGVSRVFPEAVVEKIPIGDGGEGTVDALVEANEGEIVSVQVDGPLGRPVDAFYGIVDEGTAVIEMAAASGLDLLPEQQRDVLRASTYGTGQLIMHALEQGVEEIILAIGGSATNDGGTGMAAALGYRFLDAQGEELPPGGAALINLASIDDSRVDRRVRSARFRVACDVNNPLLGERGASAVYGPQKGASLQDVQTLDASLKKLAKVVQLQFGQKVDETPGAGAAGGLGYGLLVFCGATLEKGIDIVLDAVNFDERLENKDLVITGEGKIDGQTSYGKVPIGIAYRAKQKGVPVLVIAGDIGDGIEAVYDKGIDAVMSTVNRAMSLEEAMSNGRALLIDGAERAMRMIRLGMDLC
ncbi:MAG: glycerate kinase [Spirochaetaceae bacterium]|nr:glycerate kinase [Spirochaetaceae bacterium]MCF7948290.1 glycerate kinase [Spirochaetia bacterium]MCF7951779.1 glycerate kinase [Spirochaetaceae bacterium]